MMFESSHHYKTGSVKIEKSLNEFGLNLQLPIYYYLLKNDPKFADYNISGIYYLNFKQEGFFDFEHLDNKKIFDSMLKEGLTSLSLEDFCLFEPKIINYLKSNTVKDVSINNSYLTSKNKIIDYTALLKDEEKEYPCLIDQFLEYFYISYINGDFKISPYFKSSSGSDLSCRFCNFKDICFNTKTKREKEGLFKIKGEF